jgi:hypothetical protein
MSIKPWIGDQEASFPDEFNPSKMDKKRKAFLNQIPSQNLSLQYAHGYRGFDA